MDRYTIQHLASLFFLLVISVGSGPLAAEGSASGQTQYLNLNPAFTVNVGPPGERLSFAKVEVSLRTPDKPAFDRVRRHEPALRDILVALLSNQPLGRVEASTGREALRLEALEKIQAFLEEELNEEQGQALVSDLLFTSFVVQR